MHRVHSGFMKLAFTVSMLLWANIIVTPATAGIVTFNFGGSVDSISSGLSDFNLGQKMTGFILYEDGTSNIGSPGSGQYSGAITGGSIQFSGTGGYSTMLANSPASFINIEQVGDYDFYKMHAPVANSPLDYFEITIIHHPSNFSNSLFPPTLGTIASAGFRLVFGDGGPKVVTGPVTPVPLPPAAILFAAGLVALMGLGARNWQREARARVA